MRRVIVKRNRTESPTLSYEGAQALIEQSMKPLLERIGVLEKELDKTRAMLTEIKLAAGLALASDESTRERLEGFLTALAEMANAGTSLPELQLNLGAVVAEEALAALRRSTVTGRLPGDSWPGARPNITAADLRELSERIRDAGRQEGLSRIGAGFTEGGQIARDAAQAAGRIARAYGMSEARIRGLSSTDLGQVELRPLDPATQPTRADFESIERRILGGMGGTTEADDMVENVSDDHDMPDLDE